MTKRPPKKPKDGIDENNQRLIDLGWDIDEVREEFPDGSLWKKFVCTKADLRMTYWVTISVQMIGISVRIPIWERRNRLGVWVQFDPEAENHKKRF